jgi:aconitate hydratase
MPRFPELDNDLEGRVLLKVGDDISTDHILPAGNRILPLRSNIPEISKYVFEAVDEEFPRRAAQEGGGIVVGGENYGQGSSREHAALAPRYLGIRAKLAKSFARIHKANLVNFGIVPLEFEDPADYDRVESGGHIRIPGIRKAVTEGAQRIAARTEQGEISLLIRLTDRERATLAAGGALNRVRKEMSSE